MDQHFTIKAVLAAITALAFASVSLSLSAQEADQAPPVDPELVMPPPMAEENAEPPATDPDLEKPPPLPPKVQDEQIEPTVTIRDEEDRRVEEYSLNGRVYMVKVTPDKGPPYYYVDTDGDGSLELDERSRAMHPVQPVHWKIAEWE